MSKKSKKTPKKTKVEQPSGPRNGEIAKTKKAGKASAVKAKKGGKAPLAKDGRKRLLGEKHPRAKLANADVKAARAAYKAGGVTQAALADHYSVSVTYMHKLIHGLARK